MLNHKLREPMLRHFEPRSRRPPATGLFERNRSCPESATDDPNSRSALGCESLSPSKHPKQDSGLHRLRASAPENPNGRSDRSQGLPIRFPRRFRSDDPNRERPRWWLQLYLVLRGETAGLQWRCPPSLFRCGRAARSRPRPRQAAQRTIEEGPRCGSLGSLGRRRRRGPACHASLHSSIPARGAI